MRDFSVRDFAMGTLAGGFGATAALVVSTRRRVVMLHGLRAHINDPGVPRNVLAAVRAAEGEFYRDLGPVRRLVEDTQDIMALVWPQVVFKADLSVGAYRIKAHSIVNVLQYAIKRGYLELDFQPDWSYGKSLPYFAMAPVLSEWQAAVLLAGLRERHPMLRHRSWDDIAADPEAIAKLYSGYMGAGGAWELWESDLQPGPVARYRLGFEAATGTYSRIPPPQPPEAGRAAAAKGLSDLSRAAGGAADPPATASPGV